METTDAFNLRQLHFQYLKNGGGLSDAQLDEVMHGLLSLLEESEKLDSILKWSRGRCCTCDYDGAESDRCYDCFTENENKNLWVPTEDWEDVPMVDAVVEMERDRYRKALEDIKKHMELSLPHGYQMSSVWYIAKRALLEGK